MTHSDLKQDLRDVAFTLATPFSEDGESVLDDELRANARAMADAGGELFIPCGNTGEYYSLSHEERVDVVEATVDAVGDDGTVVAGAGGSTKTVTDLVAAYEDAGVDGIMVMNPSHVYIDEAGLLEYYREIAAATDLGVVIYKRGPEITERILSELASVENVVGVKYAVDDIEAFSSAVESVDGDVVWMNGIAERFAPSFALEGAEGFTTGIGNFVPEQVLELKAALDDGDWDRALRLRNAMRPFEELRQEGAGGPQFSSAKNVPAVKYGMEVQGLTGGPVREPLVELDEEDRERVREYIEIIEGVTVTT